MADTVRFLLGDELLELNDVDPTQTILEWLRLRRDRKGSKEGCAEGDCGACTVVLAHPNSEGGLDYRAINSCIQFVPVLDGAQLLTVEDLSEVDEELHPVQAALVDHHGSQCGFCTPGFAMSLFAATKGAAQSRDDIKQTLAGNLCRCTGYGPILDAGEAVMKEHASDVFDDKARDTARRLVALANDETLALEKDGKHYFAPKTLTELDRLLSEYPEAQIIAGLSDVGLWVTKQGRRLTTQIYIGQVGELAAIEASETDLRISAAVTLSDAMPAMAKLGTGIDELMRRFASTQIRNSGTVCGNIANGSPIGDLPPVLIALGAQVLLRYRGQQRTILLEDFFVEYGKQDRKAGELVEAVIIPRLAATQTFRCYKISKRFEQDISAVMAGFCVTLNGGKVSEARLAFGGMAGIPARASNAEAKLVGQEFTEHTIAAAMDALSQDFRPLDDMRASADYRLAVARNLLLKFFHEVTSDTKIISVLELADG